jgi:hypothetical protein
MSQGSLWKLAGTLLAGGLVAAAVTTLLSKNPPQDKDEEKKIEDKKDNTPRINQKVQKNQKGQITLVVIQPEAIFRRKASKSCQVIC